MQYCKFKKFIGKIIGILTQCPMIDVYLLKESNCNEGVPAIKALHDKWNINCNMIDCSSNSLAKLITKAWIGSETKNSK
jgi:hypothetical protein